MYNHNDHKCLVCGETFYYCRSCRIEPVKHLAEGLCSETCADIFAILSKHGCNLITTEEAFLELSECNIDEISLTEGVATHIEKINSDIGLFPIVEEEVIAEEVVLEEEAQIVEKSNKNNKKKW